MASKKKAPATENATGEANESTAETLTFTHSNDEGEEVQVTLLNDNRAAEYKRGLRESGKHFSVE